MSGVYLSVSGVNIDEHKRFRADRCIFYNFSESKNVIKKEQYKIYRKKTITASSIYYPTEAAYKI